VYTKKQVFFSSVLFFKKTHCEKIMLALTISIKHLKNYSLCCTIIVTIKHLKQYETTMFTVIYAMHSDYNNHLGNFINIFNTFPNITNICKNPIHANKHLHSLLLKREATPLHFWLPGVTEGLRWENCVLLVTIKWATPLILILYLTEVNIFRPAAILTPTLNGSIRGLSRIYCKPFFSLLYNCQVLCFWWLALSIVTEVFPQAVFWILLHQGCLLQTHYA
jgi:hypothetical protein